MLKIGLKFENRVAVITVISILAVSLFSFSVFAQDSMIPEWIKNNAKWWSEGKIAESDYISALQYLINQGIIKIPITEVNAAKVSLSDSERAQSFVVHIQGEYTIGVEDGVKTFYTFSEFRHLTTNVNTSLGIIDVDNDMQMFYLMGLPSKDKSSIYQLVGEFIDSSGSPERFDVKVDVLAGDGVIIQTWNYENCNIIDYTTFLDSDKDTYRFGENDEAEIREFLLWECKEFHLTSP
jgi:hypothetical protein